MGNANVRDVLRAAGVSESSLDRIRLASGVVGKTSYVAGAALLALGSAALALRGSEYLVIVPIIMGILFVIYFVGVLWFATKNPGASLLEGAELIQWRQIEMAAKETPILTQANTAPQIVGGER